MLNRRISSPPAVDADDFRLSTQRSPFCIRESNTALAETGFQNAVLRCRYSIIFGCSRFTQPAKTRRRNCRTSVIDSAILRQDSSECHGH